MTKLSDCSIINKKITALLVLVIVLMGTAAICNEISEKETAQTNAKTWLVYIDEGKYQKSWETAAVMFKKAVSLPQWNQALSTVRTPFGKVFSRELLMAEHQTSLPGVPDGNYFVIQFSTKFEHKTHAVETITMAKESDGTWKAAGYFIK